MSHAAAPPTRAMVSNHPLERGAGSRRELLPEAQIALEKLCRTYWYPREIKRRTSSWAYLPAHLPANILDLPAGEMGEGLGLLALWCQFSEQVRFPVRPMVGTLGVAPATGEISTLYPGAHGGNMDNNEVRPGCTVHLPVQVKGGLLSVGDVHASMGDGGVTMIGLEIPAVVTCTVSVLKGEQAVRPGMEPDDG